VRKIAFLRLPPPRAVSLTLRIWRRLKRMAGMCVGASTVQPRTREEAA